MCNAGDIDINKYIIYRKIVPFVRLGWLAPARQLLYNSHT